MPLLDRFLERLDDICSQPDTQNRIQRHFLDPAVSYIAQKLFKYMVSFVALLLLQICLLMLLLYMTLPRLR